MSLFLPSYDNGFAPRDFVPEYPELWEGCKAAYCPSLGATGTSLFDQSGYNYNGTLTNFQSNSTNLSTAWADPLAFDGTNDYVDFPNAVGNIGTTDFSASFWIKTISGYAPALGGIIGKTFAAGLAGRWAVSFVNKNGALYGLVDTTGDGVETPGMFGLNDGMWHHVVLVIDRSNNQMRLHGDTTVVTAAIQGRAGIDLTNSYNNLRFGCYNNSSNVAANFFQGNIDGVLLYNRVLSLSEIIGLRSLGPGGIYTPSSRQASLIPNISATGNRRRRVIIGAA